MIVAISKIEGIPKELIAEKVRAIKKVVPKGTKVLSFSSASKDGLTQLLRTVNEQVKGHRDTVVTEQSEHDNIPIISLIDDEKAWQVTKEAERWVVTGRKIERFAARTQFGNYQAEQRLRDIMRKMGILHELRRQGVAPESRVDIGKPTIGTIEY
jgi:GTPase